MNSFHTIAIPHKDILEGRLTLDTFAADLWEVAQQRGFFSSQANLNRILMTHKENVTEDQLFEFERTLLTKTIDPNRLKVYIWVDEPSQIPDTEDLKIIILKNPGSSAMENIRRNKGQTPRVFGNTIIFLSPVDNEKINLYDTIRQKIAYQNIEKNPHLNLAKEHQETVKNQLKKIDLNLHEAIRRTYRVIELPDRDGFKKIDLGVPTYGAVDPLNKEVHDRPRIEGEILESIAPIVIREKYLPQTGKDYVFTGQLYQASLKTPGEARFINRDALASSIKEGVKTGMFGLGELENNTPHCRYFKDQCTVAFEGIEIIIRESLCIEQRKKEQEFHSKQPETIKPSQPLNENRNIPGEVGPLKKGRDSIRLKFELPRGKASNMLGVLNYLQSKFQYMEIELSAADGEITEQEYEDKIMEAFQQSNIRLKE